MGNTPNLKAEEKFISLNRVVERMKAKLPADGYHEIGDEEHYQTSRFIKALGGNTPRNRILEYLMLQEETPVSCDDASNAVSLKQEVVESVFEELVREGVLVNDKKDDSYALNSQNTHVQKLLGLYAKIMMENLSRAKKEHSR